MKLGLIGCGAMGSAIVKGATQAGVISGNNLYLYDISAKKAQQLAQELQAQQRDDAIQVVADSDIVILAVKPQHQSNLLRQIRLQVSRTQPIVVSIAAGRTIAAIEAELEPTAKVVRIMPNVNASVGQAMSGLCAGTNASNADLDAVQAIFEGVGETTVIDESLFSVYSALAGCSPAWIFRLIDAMGSAAVAHGMPKAQATKTVAQALVGSGTLMLESLKEGKVPAQLIDQVCSPAGTTIAGLLALEDMGFSPALRNAVDAAVARDEELAKSK